MFKYLLCCFFVLGDRLPASSVSLTPQFFPGQKRKFTCQGGTSELIAAEADHAAKRPCSYSEEPVWQPKVDINVQITQQILAITNESCSHDPTSSSNERFGNYAIVSTV